MREKIIETILENKIIVIVRGMKSEDIIPFAEAIYEGGIKMMEVTYNASDFSEDLETAEKIEKLNEHFGDKMLIGAGTVLTEKQVALTAEAKGKFIISPDTNEKIIKKTVELGMVSIPGALTPTEIQKAHLYGADFVKLFPVNAFGVEYVKAVKAPLSHIKLLAVGGVGPDNMSEYLKAGACGFGIGSTIVNKKMIAEKDFKGITELVKKYTLCLAATR